MREIIFRAKVKDKNELIGKGFRIDENGNLKSEWVFGVPIPHYPDLFLAWNEACNEYEEVTIIPETVGQYTGMTDKNGKKIFEGDIVKVGNALVRGIFAVEYSGMCACFIVSCGESRYFLGGCSCEVIGNVHDNPELLQD